MAAAAVRLSVVVASHGRPRALRRCLIGLHQQPHPAIEVIVVADAEGRAAIADLPFADRITVLDQDAPNLSRARNLGVAASGGEVVAFIDDDAVPEPSWADAIADAFRAPDLAAATGPVLGRNGISLQWGRLAIDARGRDRAIEGDDLAPDTGLKLHGTNMAVRRSVLAEIGGFDPAFSFFLDDTDLAWRIAGAGHRAAYLPNAVVHHSFAASTRRQPDRAPLSLFDIGASTAVFLRKHARADVIERELARLQSDQAARLTRFRQKRLIRADQMPGLMQSLTDGIGDGMARGFGARLDVAEPRSFQSLRDAPPLKMTHRAGWRWQAKVMRGACEADVGADQPVSLFLFEPTPRKHRVVFTEQGVWEQRGGLFGPSDRSQPRFQVWRLKDRLAAEIERVAALRGIAQR